MLLVGVTPLARFPTNFLGLNDRLTVVSGVGAAMVWVGGLAMVARGRRHGRGLVLAAAVGLLAIAVPVRVAREHAFREAADAALAETHRLVALTDGQRVIDVPGPIAVVHRVWGLSDGWNATAAVQLLSGDPTRVVHVGGMGPRADDPRQPFH